MLMRPIYPHSPIGSVEALSKVFGLTKEDLVTLAKKSNEYFYITKIIEKEDKSFRITYDVKTELKNIHEKICSSLLKKVI